MTYTTVHTLWHCFFFSFFFLLHMQSRSVCLLEAWEWICVDNEVFATFHKNISLCFVWQWQKSTFNGPYTFTPVIRWRLMYLINSAILALSIVFETDSSVKNAKRFFFFHSKKLSKNFYYKTNLVPISKYFYF